MSTVKTVKVKAAVDVEELRHWAGKHADAGHHGVAQGYSIDGQHSRSALVALIRREIARAEGTTP